MNVLANTLIREYRSSDQSSVISLWREVGLVAPQNDPAKDIDRKLAHSPELFLVAELQSEQSTQLTATVMGGYEGHRGWINYLAVSSELQGHGLGRLMMANVTNKLVAAGCPKINLQVRSSNAAAVEFYNSLGYQQDQVLSFGLRLDRDQVLKED